MKTSQKTLNFCIALTIATCSTFALADGKARFHRENPAGGVTAGSMGAHTGPYGGRFGGGRMIVTDGQGNGAATSGSAFKTPSGAVGARAGATTRSADGTIQHKSGFGINGAKGSATSQGQTTVSADGTVNQSRNTSVHNAQTGNSYEGNTSYNSTDGVSHSATCYDAAGSVITCPSR